MSSIKQVDFPKSSATFEFRSHFPNLHMPVRKVRQEDRNIVDPRKDECLYDGEIVQQTPDGKFAQALHQVSGAIVPSQCYLTHGKPGRSDLQAARAVVTVQDSGFYFRTKLVEVGGATPGARFKPGILPSTSEYENHGGLVLASAGEEYVAVYDRAGRDGWHEFRFERGITPS